MNFYLNLPQVPYQNILIATETPTGIYKKGKGRLQNLQSSCIVYCDSKWQRPQSVTLDDFQHQILLSDFNLYNVISIHLNLLNLA